MNRKAVSPRPITGKESTAELIANAFPAFAGRNVREALRLMRKSTDEDFTVFMTLSGAMTPAGMHHSTIVPLIENGLVHSLTTTGANLYHDVHRSIGFQVTELDPGRSDLEYRQDETVRIYDLGITNEILLETDKFFGSLLKTAPFQRPMSTPELHHEIGRCLAAVEEQRRVKTPSLLATCFRHDVPIFCGAPQDGSIFLEYLLLSIEDEDLRFRFDIRRDVLQMSALQYLTQLEGQTAIWIIGGGVPKNFTLQGEPTLSQFFGLDARGFDLDLQICVDVADNGALSPCSAGEGHTWGKTSAECVESSSVYLRADATVALPFLAHAALAELAAPKDPKRLFKRLEEAETVLRDAFQRRRKG
jgi:deoxyhypusine synthase